MHIATGVTTCSLLPTYVQLPTYTNWLVSLAGCLFTIEEPVVLTLGYLAFKCWVHFRSQKWLVEFLRCMRTMLHVSSWLISALYSNVAKFQSNTCVGHLWLTFWTRIYIQKYSEEELWRMLVCAIAEQVVELHCRVQGVVEVFLVCSMFIRPSLEA